MSNDKIRFNVFIFIFHDLAKYIYCAKAEIFFFMMQNRAEIMTDITYHRKKQSYLITYDACDRIMRADTLTHLSLYFEKLCFSV